jgi:GT2 family glycosyltransferase
VNSEGTFYIEPVLRHNRAAPVLSVVMPVYNASRYLQDTLRALSDSTIPFECIICDDDSTDDSVEIARQFGATVVSTGGRKGPAFARNIGAAQATTDLLLFVDADVRVRRDTLAHVVTLMDADPELSAVFGSYDESPQEEGFLSEYRNLMHHFVHQHSKREAHSFWSGFGAIRKDVFDRMRGFDTKYRTPAIEDIEMGYRLTQAGYRIRLEPELQVQHLKDWTFSGMLTTDILDRGIPWTELMLRSGGMQNDLNVTAGQRLSVALAFLITGGGIVAAIVEPHLFLAPFLAIIFLLLSFYEMRLIIERRVKGIKATLLLAGTLTTVSILTGRARIALASLLVFMLYSVILNLSQKFKGSLWIRRGAGYALAATIVFVATRPGPHPIYLLCLAGWALILLLNVQLYAFFVQKRGKAYTLSVLPLHMLYLLYSGTAFIIGVTQFVLKRRRASGGANDDAEPPAETDSLPRSPHP